MTIHFDPVHPDQLDLLRAISGQLASMERRIEEADRRQMEAEQRQMLILQKLQEMPSPPSIPPTCTCISNDKVASIINNLSSDQPPTLSPASSILPSPFSPPSSPYPFYQQSQYLPCLSQDCHIMRNTQGHHTTDSQLITIIKPCHTSISRHHL